MAGGSMKRDVIFDIYGQRSHCLSNFGVHLNI